MIDQIVNFAVMGADAGVGVLIIIFLAIDSRLHKLPASHRIGLWIGAVGLFGQAFRNFLFLTTGQSPTDNDLPIWVLKDMGYWVIAVTVMFAMFRRPSQDS